MFGRVEIGQQKDIKIIKRDGMAYSAKSNTIGNPGSMLPVVTDALPGQVQQFRWGLLGLNDDKIHSKNKYARIESLFQLPLWNKLVGRKHCVVRVQAYFEYNKEQNITYKVERTDGKPIYIAGLWSIWIDTKTSVLFPTFAMVTMAPNAAISVIHDRMPAMLERNGIKNGLNGNYSAVERVNLLHNHPCLPNNLKVNIHKRN